mgnify:CR=1 FL=1
MKNQRRLSASEALDRICRRELGVPLAKCNTGGVDAETVVAALESLLEAIGNPPVHSLSFVGDKEERETDDTIARMAETGSLDPVRFLSPSSQSSLRATIRLAMTEYQLIPRGPRRLRNMPDRLQGCALGLAALARHALRP